MKIVLIKPMMLCFCIIIVSCSNARLCRNSPNIKETVHLDDNECEYFFTEGKVKYLRETTFDFNPDTSAIVINMRGTCKIIDKNLSFCPVNTIVEITDVSENVNSNYISIKFSPISKGKHDALLEIVASHDLLMKDHLVPIVNKCIDFISKNEVNEPVWILYQDDIDLLNYP